MIESFFLAAALAAQSPPTEGAPQTNTAAPEISSANRAMLRCSAAFAMVSHGQSIGNEDALKWPELGTRGREFFVQALAQLMDDTGLDRDGISQLVGSEAQRLWDAGEVDAVMPACLLMLETSGL